MEKKHRYCDHPFFNRVLVVLISDIMIFYYGGVFYAVAVEIECLQKSQCEFVLGTDCFIVQSFPH